MASKAELQKQSALLSNPQVPNPVRSTTLSSKRKMKSELTIGKVLKPRGLKGELKIETYSSDSARFSHLKQLKIDAKEYIVKNISLEGAIGYVTLDTIDDVDKAEALRGKFITAKETICPNFPTESIISWI